MLSEPPDADPHVRWCGGRRGKPGAYPLDLERNLIPREGCLSDEVSASVRVFEKPV